MGVYNVTVTVSRHYAYGDAIVYIQPPSVIFATILSLSQHYDTQPLRGPPPINTLAVENIGLAAIMLHAEIQ